MNIYVHPAVCRSPARIAQLELRTGLRAVWAKRGKVAVLSNIQTPPRYRFPDPNQPQGAA